MHAALLAVGLLGPLLSPAFAEGPRVAGVTLKVEDPGPDLPPVGSSVFDKLFYSERSRSYSVPFPIKKLLDKVLSIENTNVAYTLIPFTRSLQRPIDLSYDPLKKPRMVFATMTGNPLLENKLFWAYTEARDQIEVISYNEEAGRYEFQLVENYSGRSPKVTYASRAKCMTCHQGQAPIFQVANWADTTDTSSQEMRKAVLAANGFRAPPNDIGFADELFLAERFLGSADFARFPNRRVTETAPTLERFAEEATKYTIFQRAYVHGCGDDNECRLGLLRNAAYCPIGATEQHCPHVMQVIARSALANENAASSSLSQGFNLREIFAIFFPGPNETFRNMDEGARRFIDSDELKLKVIERLRSLPPRDNPASSRITPLARTFGVQYAMNFAQDAVRPFFAHVVGYPGKVTAALEELYREGHPIFEKKPLNAYELIRAMSGKLRRSSMALLKPVRVANPEVSRKPVPTFFTRPALNALTRNCGSCHQTSETYPPQFLVGSEEQVTAKVEAMKPLIQSRIERGEMPPTPVLQAPFHESADREAILQYVRAR